MSLDLEGMKELFLTVVKRAKARYAFSVENFCVMGNHVHFVIVPARGESLSSIMQWILSVFAMAFNRRQGLTGHVWGSRFFSRILASMRELLLTHSYIDENPAKAGRVDDRRRWRWSGLWHHRVGNVEIVDPAPSWLMLVLPEHANGIQEALQGYPPSLF